MIICDSREQKNAHILAYFKRNNIHYEIAKVDTGDYINTDNPLVAIEKKKDLAELCTNLCSSDKARFYREIRRAHDSGIKLIVLCENGGKIKSLADVSSWKSKYTKVTGKWLQSEIYKVSVAYNVEFIFCDKRSTGKRIIEILTEKEK